NEDDITTNRILIQGRAGIGKTTLCQYIAYLWMQGQLWSHYKWVFWIPLRQLLKDYYTDKIEITLTEVLYQECFNGDKNYSLEIIKEILANKNEMLLLVDGYDEVVSLDN